MQIGFAAVVFFLFFSKGLGGSLRSARFDRYGDMADLVTFRLFTRQNSWDGVMLPLGDRAALLRSGFNGSLTTIFCTHGFMDSANSSWLLRTKTNILKEENVNFIAVDYSIPCKNLLYDEVVEFVKRAGNYVGQFLEFLKTEEHFQIEKTHLIGHSLGAQVMGFAAKVFPDKTIGRITGLDPAAPLFENNAESEKLHPSAAKIVDVIHTCVFFVGMTKPVGTIDFYPNGGYNQPGCGQIELKCHHASSHQYFLDSILAKNRIKYTSAQCETLNNALNGTCSGKSATMGYYLNYSSPGIYYLKINKKGF